MNIKDYDTYKREGSEITPNSFTLYIDGARENTFVLSFAEVEEKSKRVDILSEIVLNEEGVKSVFKRAIRVFIDYEKKTGRDLVNESINELVSEIGGDE